MACNGEAGVDASRQVLVLANRDLLDRQEAAETENDRLAVEYSR